MPELAACKTLASAKQLVLLQPLAPTMHCCAALLARSSVSRVHAWHAALRTRRQSASRLRYRRAQDNSISPTLTLSRAASLPAMATSQGGLRIMAGAGAKKDPATEAVAVVPGGDVKEAVAASAEVDPSAAAPASEGDAPPPRLRTERVDNVMGSQAGAGSLISTSTGGTPLGIKTPGAARRRRREARREIESTRSASRLKRRNARARTAKNAAKRRKKKKKGQRDAIARRAR